MVHFSFQEKFHFLLLSLFSFREIDLQAQLAQVCPGENLQAQLAQVCPGDDLQAQLAQVCPGELDVYDFVE